MSSFSDLGDPYVVQLEDMSVGLEEGGKFLADKSAFRLIVFGGQSDTAYRAELHFNASRLERRLVWEGEEPNQVAEETIYRTGG
jgi:hypothetical protein